MPDTFDSGAKAVNASSWTAMFVQRPIPVDATTVTFNFIVNVSGAGPHGGIGFIGEFFNVLNAGIGAIPLSNVASGATTTVSYSIPVGAVSFDISATPGAVANSNLAQVTGDTNGTPPGVTPCAGGTQRKDLTTDLVILGGALIDVIALFKGGRWLELLALLIDVIGVHVLSTATLCAGPPPPMPTITNDDYLALAGFTGPPKTDQIQKFWTAVQAAVWPYFCQCTPGTGGTPFPDAAAPNITITTPPTITCDGTDLCSFLNQLAQKIDNVSLQVQYTRRDVTLIQQQGVPFGYLPGILHTGLSGSGDFAVSDILALSVQVSTVPLNVEETPDDPGTLYSAGFITLGTAQGWMGGHRVTRNPFFLTPIQGDITRVAYSFPAGLVANIQEFVREQSV